jgi:hypothetical protein
MGQKAEGLAVEKLCCRRGFRSLGDAWAHTTTPHGRLMNCAPEKARSSDAAFLVQKSRRITVAKAFPFATGA